MLQSKNIDCFYSLNWKESSKDCHAVMIAFVARLGTKETRLKIIESPSNIQNFLQLTKVSVS